MSKAKSARYLGSVTFAALIGILLLSASSIPLARAETLGSWNATTNWKNSDLSGIAGESCFAYNGYVYCVGGYLGSPFTPQSTAEYAQISSLISSPGSNNWVATTAYPTGFDEGSCAVDTSTGYVYCVGGDIDRDGDFTTNLYYASLSSSGIGTWTSTTAFPIIISDESCAIDSNLGYIYCVGGTSDESNPQTPGNGVYTASVSASGVGTWTTGDYPSVIDGESCNVASGYIYCVGGDSIPTHETTPVPSQQVYYGATLRFGNPVVRHHQLPDGRKLGLLWHFVGQPLLCGG